MAKTTEKPRPELPPEDGSPGETETPMPTGSGVLGSRPRPTERAQTGIDPEAAERRRFRRAIKEKT